MKKLLTIVLLAGALVGMNSCSGGGSGATEKYFITIEGNEAVAQGNNCNFMADGISGKANFGFDDKSGSIELLECWNNLGEEGIAGMQGKSYSANVTLGDKTYEGLSAKITKVSKEESSMGGADYEISGTLEGEAKGEFNVSAFSMN